MALLGLWRTGRVAAVSLDCGVGTTALWLLAGVMLAVVALAVFVFEGQARYHLPVVPLLIGATALRLGCLAQPLGQRPGTGEALRT
jgi:hypothetical protein